MERSDTDTDEELQKDFDGKCGGSDTCTDDELQNDFNEPDSDDNSSESEPDSDDSEKV